MIVQGAPWQAVVPVASPETEAVALEVTAADLPLRQRQKPLLPLFAAVL